MQRYALFVHLFFFVESEDVIAHTFVSNVSSECSIIHNIATYNWCTKVAYVSLLTRLRTSSVLRESLSLQLVPNLNEIWNKSENESKAHTHNLWLAKLSLYVGKGVLIVPWLAMFWWNWKSRLEMNIDFSKLSQPTLSLIACLVSSSLSICCSCLACLFLLWTSSLDSLTLNLEKHACNACIHSRSQTTAY